jgi:hypothetical protein
MTTPQMYFSLAANFLRRNNPIEAMAMGLMTNIYNLITFQSRRKLLKYRYMLEMQKLERIEHTLNEFNPYDYRGSKMNRNY